MTRGFAPLPAIPVLETERLRLRAPRLEDFAAYAAFGASPRSATVGGPFGRARAFSQFSALIGHWALKGFGRFLVADRESDAPLGVVGPMAPPDWPEPEIAWTVFDGAEGRGIAFEAASAARAWAYRALGWRTAVSLIDPGNFRSQALARRLGCARDGAFPHEEHGELLIWRHPSPEALS